MNFIVYCPENEKYLNVCLITGVVGWSDIHRSNHNAGEIDLMENLYLGRGDSSMKGWMSTGWALSEYRSMANVMCAASASGWCLYVIPILRTKLEFGLMDRLVA